MTKPSTPFERSRETEQKICKDHTMKINRLEEIGGKEIKTRGDRFKL